jgi:hypothetical protein
MKQLLVTVYKGGFSVSEINLTVPSGMYVQLSDHRTDRVFPSKLELTPLCVDSNDFEELVRVVRQAQTEAVAEDNLKDAPRGEPWEPEIMTVFGFKKI